MLGVALAVVACLVAVASVAALVRLEREDEMPSSAVELIAR